MGSLCQSLVYTKSFLHPCPTVILCPLGDSIAWGPYVVFAYQAVNHLIFDQEVVALEDTFSLGHLVSLLVLERVSLCPPGTNCWVAVVSGLG